MGKKFEELESKLSGEKGVTDPGGLAAAIGRKKYGKKNFDSSAAKDKSPKMKKDMALDAPDDLDNEDDMDKGGVGSGGRRGVRASKKLWGEGTRSVVNPKQKNPGYGGGNRVTFESTGIKRPAGGGIGGQVKKAEEKMAKKQGVPEGVDPDKHERCVLDVKAKGNDKSSAYAICNASMNKSEIDKEIDELSERMEKSTMNPVEEIRKAIMELGPEGLKKALPEMTEDNKILLNDILEEMKKSHKVELAMPKKLVNVAQANYVEEYAPEERMSDIMVAESAAEGDDVHLHQGGAHDMAPEGWEGQIIKALMETENENEVIEGLGAIFKAWELKKAKMKKKCPEMMEGEAELDKAEDEEMEEEVEKGKKDKEMDKAVSASPKLWGSTKPRGVGIYKGDDEKDDSVAEDVKEVEGPKKLNEVLDEAPEDKKDDILRELREKKMKKAKGMLKNMMYKEMEDKDDGKEDMEKMKKKMRKALVSVLSEEYTDEEIMKAKEMIDKGGPGSGPSSGGRSAMAKERLKELDKKSKKSPVKEHGAGSDLVAQYNAKMKKAFELYDEERFDEAREEFTKAMEMGKDIAEASQVKMPADLMKEGKAGKVDPALAGDDTADEALAGLGKMKKSIKYYGGPNDAFRAGRLGRHDYTSSINEYYNEMLTKADTKESELKKSETPTEFSPYDLNDLIEMDFTTTWQDVDTDRGLRKSESEKGSFTRHSFDETDMLKSLNISKEDADKI